MSSASVECVFCMLMKMDGAVHAHQISTVVSSSRLLRGGKGGEALPLPSITFIKDLVVRSNS